jgi:hypothetical protein
LRPVVDFEFAIDTARALPDSSLNRLQRRDKVGQEAREIVVPFVQRQPGKS